jgi:hypothetical protein
MNTTILFYIILSIVVLILTWIIILEFRLKKLFSGIKAKNLEELLVTMGQKINKIEESQKIINEHLKEIDQRLNKSIRNVRTVRFNPFMEAGSNQSFAVSFINEEGDGVILSSLYARDRMSFFAKPIKDGKAEYELTEEEKDVLDKSKNLKLN